MGTICASVWDVPGITGIPETKQLDYFKMQDKICSHSIQSIRLSNLTICKQFVSIGSIIQYVWY